MAPETDLPERNALPERKHVDVTLHQSSGTPTPDQALWSAIRQRTNAIAFNRYNEFIANVFCNRNQQTNDPRIDEQRIALGKRPTLYGMDSYHLLKLATEVFLILECGVRVEAKDPKGPLSSEDEAFLASEASRRGEPINYKEIENTLKKYLMNEKALPYLDQALNAIVGINGGTTRREETLAYCEGILKNRMSCPTLLELIWSYWHEEGMLVQTMNAIIWRFQNRRRGARDPLAGLELDPLRPLNHLLWGFIQDEQHRLSVQRRAYEYDHHYGITLQGKAVRNFQPADSRSKFIKAFHNLLYRASIFYQEDADTTVVADGFPLLNAIKEVHLILAEGAHNQFGDLPWTARVEMLMTEWLLARPEMREFLRGRHMVPYSEPWMGTVDAMKKVQGWSDVTVTNFRDLGVFGEQIVLSVRYGNWSQINDQESAKNWARYWRPEIQSYIHSYLATTGVDLATDVTDTRRAEDRYLQPSVHLMNRLTDQQGRRALSDGSSGVDVVSVESVPARSLPTGRRRLLT